MLSLQPEKIGRELQESTKHLEHYLAAVRDVRSYYPNSAYCNGEGTSPRTQHENFVFDLVALNLPRLVYDNPRLTVRGLASPSATASGFGEATQDLAESIEAGVNQWVGLVNLRKTLQTLGVDYLLGWFVAMVKLEPRYPGSQAGGQAGGQWDQRIPRLTVLSPDEFRIDPYAKSYETAKWKGHACTADKDDLLAEAEADPESGWDAEALKQHATNEDADKIGREPGYQKPETRDEVTYYELWVPGYRLPDAPGPEEGYHGTIITITREGETLRAPRPYYGPRWGPYTLCGAYPVPRRIYPVSPAVAHKPIVDDLNDAIEVVQAANAGYKRIVIYEASNQALGEQLKNAEHDFLVPVSGLLDKNLVIPIEIGGATEHQLRAVAELRDRLDRASGLQEAARGAVSGSTATEVGVADSAHQMRTSYLTQTFGDGVIQMCKTAAWFLHMDDRVVFGLDGENVPVEGHDGIFYGGLHEGQMPEDFDDLLFDLEPLSMERTAQGMQQRRMQAAVDTVVTIAPLIAQMPHIDWRRLLELVGDAHQLRRFDEIILTDQLMAGQAGAVPGAGLPTDPAMAAAVDPATAPIPEEEPTLGELLAAAESQGQETGAATAADMGAGVA